MLTVVWAYHGYDERLAPESRDEGTWVYGEVHADPMPTQLSVTVNDDEFSGPSYWSYQQGYIYFGSWEDAIVIYSGFDPLEVAVRTSAGTIAGTVSLPDEITHLELSEAETLELGESLTVSWPVQDADFYYFGLDYEWGDWEYAYVETVISGNSVTIDGSFFHSDGIIWSIWVQPTSGPMPRPGAIGNMSGYGSGYLYYSSYGYWMGDEIQVGDGLEWRGGGPRARSLEVRKMKAQRTILRTLGVPVQLDG